MGQVKFRFHLLGLPHTKTNLDYCACAYTNKTYKMAQMMLSLGHEVIHYGAEGSDVPCTENVVVITDAQQKEVYGDYDHKRMFFKWDQKDLAFKIFNKNASREIAKRKHKNDFILVQGTWHYGATEGNDDITAVDYGVGYTGVFTKYRVFESYAWMHHVYGLLKQDNGSWYDDVIPNYFDVSQFELRPKKDYFLYFGRLIPRKGLQVVADIAERLKIKVLCVGQGKLKDPEAGWDNCNISSKYLEHIGSAGVEQRKILMSEARACFMPTYYLEPFGGVAVEAQLSGTPVIASDWGAFPETILHGVTGYRCHTLEQFCWATKNSPNLSPEKCREWAVKNYGMDRVKLMYQEYFQMVYNVNSGKGWYEEQDSRTELDWLKKEYV